MRSLWVFVFRGLVGIGLVCGVAACGSGGRTVSISTEPNDAMLLIDDTDTVRAPSEQKFRFIDPLETHKVLASRFGYSDQQRVIREDPTTGKLLVSSRDSQGRDFTETIEGELKIVLSPKRRKITFNISPVAGDIFLDGQPLSPNPVTQISKVVQFDIDAKNNFIPHTVTVKRFGFPDVATTVQWTDPQAVYNLQLEPYRKDLHIVSRPPGAEIFINGEPRGAEPVSIKSFPFPVDPETNTFKPQIITAKKPGFDPVEQTIGWDDGKTDYAIDLSAKSKSIRIVTDPPGAIVSLDGAPVQRDAAGASTATLSFAPMDDKGTPKIYSGKATKQVADTEWESAPFQIAWDGGKKDYAIQLTQVKFRPVTLLRPRFARGDRGWGVSTETVQTSAPRDVAEGGPVTLAPILRLPDGGTIDTLATSPDGSQIVFTTLIAGPNGQLRSQLELLDVDGPGAAGADAGKPRMLGDDQGLALTPSFSPDGKLVLFGSNRDGKRPGIWSIPADGSGRPTRLTGTAGNDSIDLWPSLDSLPHPRLFYESLLDARPDARLFFAYTKPPQPAADPVDLAQGGIQPHVSPEADRVLFAAPVPGTPDTGRRHLYSIPDNGGQPTELTHDPAADDFDPVWSKDASRIAFVSDRAPKASTRPATPGDYNIWMLDVAHPEAAPVQLTTSPAWDDCPAWDADGKVVYFRSNRGGTWGIWKATLK